MSGDPVARRMVDGVARRSAHTEHLTRGVLEWAERRQVLVTVSVDLVGAHDHVSPTGRHDVEDF
ncbi:Uncharacterised protein [Mycobacteroides abscessus subsp. abscessus]|nr:Uncharacterised protein [Mycobacteroides abscessus subsp. abscessus]